MTDNHKQNLSDQDERLAEENAAKKTLASIKRRELAYSKSSQKTSSGPNSDKSTALMSRKDKRKLRSERNAEPKVELSRRTMLRQRELILITIPFVLYGILFYYIPLGGWVMAFQKYKPQDGLLGSQWV